jgi:amino acid transporter
LISPDGLFVVSIIVWLWVTFMIAVGAYWYRKVQRIGYYIASIVMAISLISMFLTPTETFITSYNRFMEWAFGVENAYSYTITKAAELGFSLGKEINWDATIRGLVPYMMFMFTYVVWGNPMYGEITGVNEVKITWKTLWPADLYNMFLGVMIILATQHVIGWEFYMSSAYLWCIGEGLHPYYPYPQLYWSLVNPVAGLLIAIGMNFWIWPWIMNFICTSRVALAMAFDRVLPEFIGRVDSRFRTPYGALTMFAIFSLILSYFYCYHEFWRYFLFASFGSLIAYGTTCFAGFVLPWLRKEWYSGMLERYKVGPIPLVSLLGACGAAFITWTGYRWFIDARYGINDPVGATFVIVIYGACIISYFAFKLYRKRQGIDITKTFKEIPYE